MRNGGQPRGQSSTLEDMPSTMPASYPWKHTVTVPPNSQKGSLRKESVRIWTKPTCSLIALVQCLLLWGGIWRGVLLWELCSLPRFYSLHLWVGMLVEREPWRLMGLGWVPDGAWVHEQGSTTVLKEHSFTVWGHEWKLCETFNGALHHRIYKPLFQ